MRRSSPAIATLTALLFISACDDLFRSTSESRSTDVVDDSTADVLTTFDPAAGTGLGEACDSATTANACRFGLRCVDAICTAVGDTPANRPCILTAECAANHYCSFAGICLPAGDAAVGEACGGPQDCQAGLICATTGLAGQCQTAGGADIGDSCAGPDACLAGLVCNADGQCGAGSPAFGFRLWGGVACEPSDSTAVPRVHFELPGAPSGEFFRLPFPNDIRLKNGLVDLSGFPVPGPGIIGFDPVARIIDAAEGTQRGWSTVPSVIFRFSHPFDLQSVWGRRGLGPTARATDNGLRQHRSRQRSVRCHTQFQLLHDRRWQ